MDDIDREEMDVSSDQGDKEYGNATVQDNERVSEKERKGTTNHQEDAYDDDEYEEEDSRRDAAVSSKTAKKSVSIAADEAQKSSQRNTKKNYDESSSDGSDTGADEGSALTDLALKIQLCCYHGDLSELNRLLDKLKNEDMILSKDRHVMYSYSYHMFNQG
jgi:hypothetical protein